MLADGATRPYFDLADRELAAHFVPVTAAECSAGPTEDEIGDRESRPPDSALVGIPPAHPHRNPPKTLRGPAAEAATRRSKSELP